MGLIARFSMIFLLQFIWLLPEMKKVFVVIGLGYGDEGKGKVVDYLCKENENSIVIRFNGGQQAGHSIYSEGGFKPHMFSNFGSGTFRGIPTLWLNYCTVYLTSLLEEYENLEVEPFLYLDFECPLTTSFDVLFNRALEDTRESNRVGSCGLGFGATIERSINPDLRFTVGDLSNRDWVKNKLAKIIVYYKSRFISETKYLLDDDVINQLEQEFWYEIEKFRKLILSKNIQVVDQKKFFCDSKIENLIFEGAQGILLDQKFGNFPYITKSNSSSQNVFQFLDSIDLKYECEVYYTSRTYLTRHGNGPFNSIVPSDFFKSNQFELNLDNHYQGTFKFGLLDVNKLSEAISFDLRYSKDSTHSIVFNCFDQLKSPTIPVFHNSTFKKMEINEILYHIKIPFSHIMIGNGPKSCDFVLMKIESSFK